MPDTHILFKKAAIAGDLAELHRLADAGAEIDCHDENSGYTPLMAACVSPRAGLEVVKFLLDQGADVNAVRTATYEKGKPLIGIAISNPAATLEKIQLLIERGADLNFHSPDGYTLMTWAACADRLDVMDILLAAGAPLDGQSEYRESALSVLSRKGHFWQVSKLLDHGADPAPLEWTPLHRAIAIGSLEEVKSLLEEKADPEAVDFWERSAFLLAIQAGDPDKAALLLSLGAKRTATGRCGKPPAHYPIDRDDIRMLQWLIDQGFDLNQENEFGHSPLMEAAENSAAGCFRLLVESGAEWIPGDEDIISRASHSEIVSMLDERGEDLSKLEAFVLRKFIGLDTSDELPVSKEEFVKNRTRKFGISNPERMDIPFWNAMVRCGWSGFQAAMLFDEDSFETDGPVWCHDRFGMSLTRLPDGRFIQIAGEHEDSYDPDFCIYNDVFIHDGKGGFEILGYPEEVFPPTDFHSATLVPPWIYIIGNLGYGHGYETPVYRIHIETFMIERVATQDFSPGWIHKHTAKLENGGIRISGGKIQTLKEDNQSDIRDNEASYILDLGTFAWSRCEG